MSLEVNKVVAAVLTAGIAFMVTGVVGDAIIHPRRLETPALAVPTATVAAPASAPAEEIPPIAPLLVSASADTGRQLVQRNCGACHNFAEGGPNGVGRIFTESSATTTPMRRASTIPPRWRPCPTRPGITRR